MIHRPCLGLALAFTTLAAFAFGAFAQDPAGGPLPAPPGPGAGPSSGPSTGGPSTGGPSTGTSTGPAPAAPGETASNSEELDTRVDLKGNRFRVTLKNGNIIVGVMPNGLVWEKPDELGIYEKAKESDTGAGLRLYYVLGMDGDLFISRVDIGSDDKNKLKVRDLGELTEAQKAEIRENILNDRRKVIEDREVRIKEELARITADEEKANDGESGGEGGGPGSRPAPKPDPESAEAKVGDALLAKFPYPDWSEDRVKDILRREVVNGIFRNEEEREFIDGFKLWKAALERRQEQEAEQGGR